MIIPHSRLDITEVESAAVANVVRTGALAQGKEVSKFENNIASFLGVKGGVAVNSGTSALHLALLAIGVKPEDEVILPTYLCVAPLNAVLYTGANPILADIDPSTGNISPESAAQLITPKTKAIISNFFMFSLD